jgi:2-dehydro-3-deoxyphosphogluconate aldolase/(4S)-4-hydroxy-2-oxoglutarate aldolase
MPSGGVEATKESVQEWIQAGTTCLGMGGNLIKKDWVKAGDYASISGTVRQVLDWIAQARA